MSMFGYAQRRRVVIQLLSGTAVAGVITRKRREFCVVQDVEIVEPGGHPVRADGEVLVERANIDYIQVAG